MDNLINFPVWIIEKERKLDEMEFNLSLEKIEIEREKSKIRRKNQDFLFRNFLCFFSGMGLGMVVIMLST